MTEKILDNRLNLRNNCNIFDIFLESCMQACAKIGIKSRTGAGPARQTPFDLNAQHKLHCADKI